MIRKRKTKVDRSRLLATSRGRRNHLEEEEEEDAEENVENDAHHHRLREHVKLRRDLTVLRSKGMTVSSDGLRNDLLAAGSGGGGGGIAADKDDSGTADDGRTMLGTEITRGGLVTSSSKGSEKKSLVERKMEEYIEQEMQRRGLISERTLADRREREEAEKKLREELSKSDEFKALQEDELYEVPEHLKPKNFLFRRQEEKDDEEAEAAEAEDTSTLQVLGGVAEVDLPVEYKLRNIEETERAKREAEERMRLATRERQGSGPGAEDSAVDLLPANMTKDYAASHAGRFMLNRSHGNRQHQHHNLDRRSHSGESSGGGGQQAHDGTERRRRPYETASDDRVYERFKKRMRGGRF